MAAAAAVACCCLCAEVALTACLLASHHVFGVSERVCEGEGDMRNMCVNSSGLR